MTGRKGYGLTDGCIYREGGKEGKGEMEEGRAARKRNGSPLSTFIMHPPKCV